MSTTSTQYTAGLQGLAQPPDWLAALADPARVREQLAAVIPNLQVCEVERIRIKHQGCTARYRVTVREAGEERTLELEAEVVPPGRLELTGRDSNDALPALDSLRDPAVAARMISAALGGPSGPYPGYRVRSCAAHVMRYKPGSRCTMVYDLELEPPAGVGWPRSVVGKTYHGDKGEVAWAAMRDLWESSHRCGSPVMLAEPLAYLAGQRVLLQRAIPHTQTLKVLLGTTLAKGGPGLIDTCLEETARGLAAIHRSGVPAVHTHGLADELAEAREVLDRLAELVPELDAAAAAQLLDHVEHAAAGQQEPQAVPSHGSFRPAQVVVGANGRIGFIDFDSFCLAEPAMDIALFCSSLADTGLRALAARDGGPDPLHLDVLDTLCHRFLAAYERVAPLHRPRVRLWWQAYALTGVLHCWTKVKFGRLDSRMALLEHALRPPEILA